jgi:hypothetical protein
MDTGFRSRTCASAKKVGCIPIGSNRDALQPESHGIVVSLQGRPRQHRDRLHLTAPVSTLSNSSLAPVDVPVGIVVGATVRSAIGGTGDGQIAAGTNCSCLTKQYLNDGSVLFQDICTKEVAAAARTN